MEKRDNNLVLIKSKNRSNYYTSISKAAKYLGVQANSVNWAITRRNILKDKYGDDVTVEITDGSEVKYKQINNM